MSWISHCIIVSGKLRLVKVVSRDIRRILTQRAGNFNIALDDVSITQLTFGKEYTHAIEAKQVAQQEAERAKFIVSLAPELLNTRKKPDSLGGQASQANRLRLIWKPTRVCDEMTDQFLHELPREQAERFAIFSILLQHNLEIWCVYR